MIRSLLAAFLLLVIVSPLATAQDTPMPSSAVTKTPDYDVVSIHIERQGQDFTHTEVKDGAYSATNVTIKDLLEQAYDVREDLISGVPASLGSVQFDVRAKIVDLDLATVGKLTDPQRRAMLLPILAERFHLKAHLATRDMPVYDLTLQKDGPKFSLSPDQTSQDESTTVHNTAFKVRNTSMAIFAKTLSHQLHRTVIDKTGLTGIYDLDLRWTGDDLQNPDPNAPPGLFTALEEQLGLKLQSAKGPVSILVVDHIELPTEN
jgi:uncharacterized protein (TIGR03435 family)